MDTICCVVGAMEPGELVLPPKALLIAADAGLAHLERRGLSPDMVVGDFDSLPYAPQGANVRRYPVEKDDTDMMLSVKLGLERGCRTFLLYGGLGGRLDHSYANLQALSFLSRRGARGYLLGEGMVCSAIENGRLTLPTLERGHISVFCPGETAHGVTISGLHYPLTDGILTADFPLGVSNHFVGKSAFVEVRDGTVLVMWQQEPGDFVRWLENIF